jgi:hypothetical protein
MLLVVEWVLEAVRLVPLRLPDVAALVGVVAVAFRPLVGVVFPFVVFVSVVAVAFRPLVGLAALVGVALVGVALVGVALVGVALVGVALVGVVFPFVVFVGVVAVAFRPLAGVAALVGVAVVFVVDNCTLGTGFTAGLLSNVTPFK